LLATLGALWLLFGRGVGEPGSVSRWQPQGSAGPSAAKLGGIALPMLGDASAHSTLLLPSSGPFRHNVVAALEANGGALQRVVIEPGASWSFNRAIGDPGRLTLHTINGIYGGGWCDLASQYVIALRPVLPRDAFSFYRHRDVTGIGLSGIADDDAVAIWNTNNTGGEQDLVIRNTTANTLVLTARLVGAGVEVRAVAQ
jgi:hypothetical protein